MFLSGRARRQLSTGLAWLASRLLLLVALALTAWAVSDAPPPLGPPGEGGAAPGTAAPAAQGHGGPAAPSDGFKAFASAAALPVILALVLWLAARLYLYERYGRMGLAAYPGSAAPLPRLLASQRRLIDRLQREIVDHALGGEPRLVALRGGWGSGKSFVLRAFSRELEHADGAHRPVVVYIDVWRHSTEPDLHFALLEALLAHPGVPPFPALIRYPLAVLPTLCIRYMNRVLHRGHLQVGPVDVTLTLPALLWQRTLESTVAAVSSRHPVVWILDEVDRCSADMAQSAITLARRALALPGCTVVLPYVEGQLNYKVFNPFQPTRPDLESTMSAVIADYYLSTDGAGSIQDVLGGDGGPSDLARHYRQANRSARDRLTFLFSEKYLSVSAEVPHLSVADVVDMIETFPKLKPYHEAFLAEGEPDQEGVGAGAEELAAALRHAIGDYRIRIGLSDTSQAPSLRHLEGELLIQLEEVIDARRRAREARDVPEDSSKYWTTCFVTAVLLAYWRALEHTLRQE